MLLTIDEVRGFITTSLGDDELLVLLTAAEEAIVDFAGQLGYDTTPADLEEHFAVHGPRILLSRRASAIVSVTEDDEALDTDDYALRPSGLILDRRDDGTTPALYWRAPTVVTYTPLSDVAERQLVQVELVKLGIAFNPMLASQTIGPWSESYSTGRPYIEQRAEILASLGGFAGIR